jgi:NTP pyrophosphatase (non-canonical NTP hydrolase)
MSEALEVMNEIAAEIRAATQKFPEWPTDPIHAAGVVLEESGELAKAVLQETYEPHKQARDAVRKEAIQTAAMAIRFLLSIDRYQFAPSAQHRQGK